MADTHSFLDDPGGTREEIMRATYLALCEHGYAGLTVERIGEEFPKSKSLIYHHYDGKDDLLLDFLEFLLEHFEAGMPPDGDAGPRDHLESILDHVLAAPLPERRQEFLRAMVELRAQAAHDPAYRDQFGRHDRFLIDLLATVIERGIEEGVFREVDPDEVAGMLVAMVHGAMAARVTTSDDPVSTIRAGVDDYVLERLLVSDR
ncbi:MAG: TetR family transcriptional regulator C-terminal domain-containing protein [Haloarculaceae archaeon]